MLLQSGVVRIAVVTTSIILGTLQHDCYAQQTQSPGLPATSGMLTFFYYDDHDAAIDFYSNTLGFEIIIDEGWLVVVEAAPGSRIAITNATDGFLRPVKDKGAVIAIETEALEAWYDRLKGKDGIEFLYGWENGDYVQQFRMYDPGGYLVEFFRWKPEMLEKYETLR